MKWSLYECLCLVWSLCIFCSSRDTQHATLRFLWLGFNQDFSSRIFLFLLTYGVMILADVCDMGRREKAFSRGDACFKSQLQVWKEPDVTPSFNSSEYSKLSICDALLMKKLKPTQSSFMSGSNKIQAIKVLLKQLLLIFLIIIT